MELDLKALSNSKPARMHVSPAFVAKNHPWVQLEEIVSDSAIVAGSAVELMDESGCSLGCGIYDPRDLDAAWRRYSFADAVSFDEAYVATAIEEALSRRGNEGCQRIVHSDADYLPGLIVEQYEQIFTVTAETAAMDVHLPFIVDLIKEICTPHELVFRNHVSIRKAFDLECSIKTMSSNHLKARWMEIDGILHRVDCMQPEKPCVQLDQREQYALVGSLCEGRCVLDAYAHSGGFALSAASSGAEHVVAIDSSELCVKAIGASAQRNDCFIEAIQCDVLEFLKDRQVGDFDCIVLDPPEELWSDEASIRAIHEEAFRILPKGGILATYARLANFDSRQLERIVSAAAGLSGREGRIFARTGLPFDFPCLLNLPETSYLKGLIILVE